MNAPDDSKKAKRGPKPKFDYARIADEYNVVHGPRHGKVDAVQVETYISRRKALFTRLMTERPPSNAYFWLREVIEGRASEGEVGRQNVGPLGTTFIRAFKADSNYVRRVPKWFLALISKWLRDAESNPDSFKRISFSSGRPITIEDLSLSLYLMLNCFTDQRFQWALKVVRRVWKVRGKSFEEWLDWLFEQQKRATLRLNDWGLSLDSPANFAEPLYTVQNIRLIDEHGWDWLAPYGLPIHDYRKHLGVLARLAGGDPDSDLWQDWVEALVWSLKPRPGCNSDREFAGRRWSLRTDSRWPSWREAGRELIPAPPTEPAVVIQRPEYQAASSMHISIPSRWVSMSRFSENLRFDILNGILKLWGAHRDLPSHAERMALLKRARTGYDAPKAILEHFWDSQEEELMALAEDERTDEELKAKDRISKSVARSSKSLRR